MTRYTHQTLGFLRESQYGIDPISTASTEYWKLFKYNIPWGDFPTEQRELMSLYTGAATTPQENFFVTHAANGSVAGTAINMIPLQMAMTKVGNVVNNDNTPSSGIHEHKWKTRPVGEALDHTTMRTEDGNDSVTIRESIVGNYIQNIVTAMDLSQQSNMITHQLNTVAQRIKDPNFDANTNNLVFPGGDSDYYQLTNGFEMIWGGNSSTDADGFNFYADDGSGTDITDDVLNWALTVNNTMQPDKPHDQDYPDNYLFGIQTPIISFDLYRQGSTSKQVYDDFVTMQDNSTTKSLHIKVYQTANHYVELFLEDITLGRAERKHTRGTQQQPVFRCNGMLKEVNVREVNGLAGGTYYV